MPVIQYDFDVNVQEVDLYRNRAKSENPPHVFAMADSAYHTMLHQKQSQCIIISGESGSGKTVTANLLLKQLVTLGKVFSSGQCPTIVSINKRI